MCSFVYCNILFNFALFVKSWRHSGLNLRVSFSNYSTAIAEAYPRVEQGLRAAHPIYSA